MLTIIYHWFLGPSFRRNDNLGCVLQCLIPLASQVSGITYNTEYFPGVYWCELIRGRDTLEQKGGDKLLEAQSSQECFS